MCVKREEAIEERGMNKSGGQRSVKSLSLKAVFLFIGNELISHYVESNIKQSSVKTGGNSEFRTGSPHGRLMAATFC